MTELPLMGLGPMQWLANVKGGSIWDYVKPAPTQAIAAMLAAGGLRLPDAALAAHTFVTTNKKDGLALLDGSQVVVVEDNPGGVRAARSAAATLGAAGVRLQVIGFGVARDEAKRAALSQVCDAVFDDVNQALQSL
jgi:beta-phosphoglucomutase-like phosphatase (HAD superfamily)